MGIMIFFFHKSFAMLSSLFQKQSASDR
jgi:hypothetical protein